MRNELLHIIVISMTLFLSCSNKPLMEEPLPAVKTRSITLNLNINTKAPVNASGTSGMPMDLGIWVYEGDGAQPLYYGDYTGLNWAKVDGVIAPGQTEYYTIIEPVRLEKVRETATTLRVYAVVNPGMASWKYPEDSFATLSESELKGQTFTEISDYAGDNEVPMYGLNTLTIDWEKNEYHASMTAERCVGKVELYFTKSSPVIDLTIQEISITKIPDSGFLVPVNVEGIGSTGTSVERIYGGTGEIQAVLNKLTPQGQFSSAYLQNNACFDYISQAYLYERKGLKWTVTAGDEVYPTDWPAADAYVMTLRYLKGDEERTEPVFLSTIERNTRYCIFIRVSEDFPLEVNTVTVPWIEGEGDYTVDVTPGLD